jgi:hypothetical protein
VMKVLWLNVGTKASNPLKKVTMAVLLGEDESARLSLFGVVSAGEHSRDESKPGKVRLHRSDVGKRGAGNALGLEGLHEADVRNEDGHPSEGSEDGDEGDEVGEDLLGSTRNGEEAADRGGTS